MNVAYGIGLQVLAVTSLHLGAHVAGSTVIPCAAV